MCVDHHVAGSVLVLLAVGWLAMLLLPWWAIGLLLASGGVAVGLLILEVRRTLRRRAVVGPETLPGASGVVVADGRDVLGGRYVVRLGGELWTAASHEGLEVGDQALVLEVENGHLVVCRLPDEIARLRRPQPLAISGRRG